MSNMDLNLDLGLNQNDPWIIKKTLAASDLEGSVVLPKNEMEWYIIPEMGQSGIYTVRKDTLLEGAFVKVKDVASDEEPREIRLILSIGYGAPQYGSYSFTMGWRDLVTSRNLKAGDMIGLCWDCRTGTFKFKVLVVA